MIFIANSLDLNGGTTFLIRTCEALAARGVRSAVVVLRGGGDARLAAELARHAAVVALETFQLDRGRLLQRHFAVFAPIAWQRLSEVLAPFGSVVHAMGAFGLIVAARLAARSPRFRVTVGIYHQNEFIYVARPVFSNEVLRLFQAIPEENVLFFNELSRSNYSIFHRVDYDGRSPLTPIGIKIPRAADEGSRRPGYDIISIGNLEHFKTYNRHVIGLLPLLRDDFPGVRYHVYGGGDCLEALRAQADALGVGSRVLFHGSLAYERLPAVIREADVFVGSGTALIEAASLGRPSLVGIESVQDPVTYGFLSDIQGLSYNETGAALPMRPMLDCLRDVFSSADRWRAVAAACAAKAQDFSVDRTSDGLVALAANAVPTPDLLSSARLVRMLAGLPLLALWDLLTPDLAFAGRRNQSFQR